MAEVKWIKITTDMFDNRKIKHLRKMPEGNNIVLIWVMLLTMAGRCNASGMIFLTENIPYTTKMLADELDFDENTIILALKVLSEFGMIVYGENCFSISNWEEHQNIDGMERIREQNRIRKQKQREREKMLALEDSHAKCHVTVTQSHATDIDIDKDIDIYINNPLITQKVEDDDVKVAKKRINYTEIVKKYNSICVSLQSVRKISEARKKSINARLQMYTMDEIITVFEKAEASDFLKGASESNFKADFDWLMKDRNMAKVLEGKYDNNKSFGKNKSVEKPKTTNKFNNFNQRNYTKEQLDELEKKLLSK